MTKVSSESKLGSLIHKVLGEHPAFQANPLGDWQDIVGEQVARYSHPQSVKDRVLVITAYDSIWKHHLDLNKEILINKINKDRPEPIVEKIVVRVGEVPESLPPLNPNHDRLKKIKPKLIRPKKKKITRRSLTIEEEALLSSLPDPELRAIGKRLLSLIPADDQVSEESGAKSEE